MSTNSNNVVMKYEAEKRGLKLLEKIKKGDNFRDLVASAQKIYGIPENGYTKISDVYSWYSFMLSAKSGLPEFNNRILYILRKLGLPKNTWWNKKVIECVLANGAINFLTGGNYGNDPFIEITEQHLSKSGSYIGIRLYAGVTQRDIRDFVEHYNINPSYKIGDLKKIRAEKDSPINDIVVKLYDMPANERKEMAEVKEGMMTTKEIEIGRILEKQGINKTGEAVKALKYRRKKNKR